MTGKALSDVKYKAYPEYRKSQIEWMHDVPVHWSNVPLKYMAIKDNSLFLDGDWIESKDISNEGIRYITTGNVGEGIYKEQGAGFISEATFNKLSCTEVYEGDLLLSRLNAPIGRACIVPKLSTRVVTSVDNVIFRPDAQYLKQFLVYLFSSSSYFKHTSNLARGATMQRISRGLLGNIRVVIPTYEEQQKIASFLDHETAKIDTLIAKQEKLIELLKEKRQAVISHAVTKGLNPNAPMRDSGVEWLGEVPKHWEIKKIKHCASLISSKQKIDGQPVIALENIEGLTGDFVATNSNYNGEDVAFLEGDILFGKLRPYLAKVFLCQKSGIAFGDLLTYRPNQKTESSFLFYTMISSWFIEMVDSSTYGAKMPRASSEFVNEMFICFPPLEEQKTIYKELGTILQHFKTLTDKANKAIELMKERKTALISAAVTGKIDVRDFVSEQGQPQGI